MTLPRLLTLKEAAAELNGAVKEGALRKAGQEGKLALYEIGGRHYTTAEDLNGMLTSCRIQPRAQGSTSESGKAAPPSGASGTPGESNSALVAAMETARALKKPSPNTSPRNTPAPRASVTPIRPASRM